MPVNDNDPDNVAIQVVPDPDGDGAWLYFNRPVKLFGLARDEAARVGRLLLDAAEPSPKPAIASEIFLSFRPEWMWIGPHWAWNGRQYDWTPGYWVKLSNTEEWTLQRRQGS
jgi:hypothetical protein